MLNKESLNILSKIAKIIKNNPDILVVLEGHTDNIQIIKNNKYGYIDNLDLSLRRSAGIARLLLNKYKISQKRIIVSGRGEFAPLNNNITIEDKNANRRIRVLLVPKISELYKF